jgi:hypothetical protein
LLFNNDFRYLTQLYDSFGDLISLLNDYNYKYNVDDPAHNEPNSNGSGPGTGGNSPNPDGNDPDKRGNGEYSGKGKGKARAITPEEVSEKDESETVPKECQSNTEEEDERFQADIEKAIFNSLNENQNPGESSKQGANLEYIEKQKREDNLNAYYQAENDRTQSVLDYNKNNEILQGDKLDSSLKEYYINKSIELRAIVDNDTKRAEELRNKVDLPEEQEYSPEEYSYEEDSSEDNRSGYSEDEESRYSKGSDSEDEKSKSFKGNNSEDEESRPSKRNNSEDEESRPYKRPRK